MIIDNKNATEKPIYSAYGYTVNAIEAIYRWTYDGSNREQKCYTMVSILDSENVEIFRFNGFNNPVFADILEKNIDCFLWWIKTDKPNAYNIEKTFYDAIIKNSCLFSYRIDQRKRREAELSVGCFVRNAWKRYSMWTRIIWIYLIKKRWFTVKARK